VPESATYALVAGLVLVGVAIIIWTFRPALRGPEAAQQDVGTHRLVLGCCVAVLLLSTLLTIPLTRELRSAPFTLANFVPAALATQIPILVVLYARLIWPRAVTWQDLGLRPMPVARVARVGLATGLLAVLCNVVVGLTLTQLGLRPNQSEQFEFVRGAGSTGLLIVLALACGSAPFVEELFFRGFVFGLYRRRQPLWVAYTVSGAIFAAAHVMPTRMNPQQGVGLAIGIFALGTILAWTYQRTGSLWPGMVAHAFNNATGILALYAVTAR
jgi:membrane protease YdiL (CAAX protease family)